MNFRDLEYLVAVSDLGHFGKAAQQCHVSQSALSIQLRKLEEEMGVQLIERTSRRVVVSEAGRLVVERARAILQARRELLDTAGRDPARMPPMVSIGMIPTIAPFKTGPVVEYIQRRHSGTRVKIVEDLTRNLVQGTVRGELDAAILATATDDSLIEEVALGEDELMLAVSRSHPLARREKIQPSNLAAESMLLLQDGHCLGGQAADYCSGRQVGARLSHVATSVETLKSMVRSGLGVTLIPRMALDVNLREKGLMFLPMTPAPRRTIRVITRRTSRIAPALTGAIREAMRV